MNELYVQKLIRLVEREVIAPNDVIDDDYREELLTRLSYKDDENQNEEN